MSPDQLFSFGPYRVDPARGQLWRSTQAVKITPKAMAVLCVFLTRPGQVVTKEEIFQTVWPQTVVSDAALTVCIQELRRVLREDARQPRYLETVHRRGFRFIAPLTAAPPVSGSRFQVSSAQSAVRFDLDLPLAMQSIWWTGQQSCNTYTAG